MNPNAPYWTSVLDDFVAFSNRYDPEFARTIAGASPQEISRVEGLAGVALPPEYRAFLEKMGNTKPQALGEFLQYCSYGIEAIENFYSTPNLRPPGNAAFLWTYDVDSAYDIFIRTGGEERLPRFLVQCAWALDPETNELLDVEPDQSMLGSTLPEYLYRDAFLHIRDPLLPHGAQVREPSAAEVSEERHMRRRSAFRTIAARLDFQPVPFMENDLIFYDRPDASLKLYAQLGADVIYVQAEDLREAARICEILSDSLEMVVWQ
jgi:hypothetical protein